MELSVVGRVRRGAEEEEELVGATDPWGSVELIVEEESGILRRFAGLIGGAGGEAFDPQGPPR